jgi:hypothetical protein
LAVELTHPVSCDVLPDALLEFFEVESPAIELSEEAVFDFFDLVAVPADGWLELEVAASCATALTPKAKSTTESRTIRFIHSPWLYCDWFVSRRT